MIGKKTKNLLTRCLSRHIIQVSCFNETFIRDSRLYVVGALLFMISANDDTHVLGKLDANRINEPSLA